MGSRLYTIAAGVPFADTLAGGLIETLAAERDPLALASATIYLPTRRAVRTLAESFARALNGAALLPQIRALGDIDDEEYYFDPSSDDLALAPVIDPVRRRLLLATMVQRWAQARRQTQPQFAQAAIMARSLARFLDEAETQGADLGQLEKLAPEELAEHWADVLGFLVFLREEWPKLLAAEGAVDPARLRNLLLAKLARRIRNTTSSAPVIAAGTTGSIPATAELLSAIASIPAGMIVLPALDREMDDDSWGLLEPSHPQYGLKQLLERIGVVRGEVRDWPGTTEPSLPRTTLLREVMRPAPTTDAWRALADHGSETLARGLDGMGVVIVAHPGDEAMAVALVLREAIEKAEITAALVTPDRNLARRVAAELLRWKIEIDDSAGLPLARTPPAVFLALLAEAGNDAFPPVSLLALLKHPFAAGGQRSGDFRRRVRALDRFVLRGPRPDPGLAGIAKAIEGARAATPHATARSRALEELAAWFAGVSGMLHPFGDAMSVRALPLPDLVRQLRDAGERLAATADTPGREILWRGDEGEAAAQLMEALALGSEHLPPIEPSSFPALWRQFAEERAIRPTYGRHPRLAILGPLEARLQHFDLVVLGGLNEGTWPRSASADPWLSRPMRKTLGLESPERAIGLAAHDFATLAAASRVRLTRALKVEGTPTVASRWLQRLQQLTKGLGLQSRLATKEPYAAYAFLFATPGQAAAPASRPEPRPPVARRPRQLSITQIESWLRDPYAIYARHILRLKPLDPLDAEIGPMDRGSVMHDVLHQFMKEVGEAFPEDAEARLIARADEAFARHAIPRSALALWRPRFARAAVWFVADEKRRRSRIARSFLEIEGRIEIDAPAGPFVLKGRADRIDAFHSSGAAIIDYKTGLPPSDSQVGVFALQLPLEAAMLERGGFAEIGPLEASQLVYIRFAGGPVAGDYHVVKGDTREIVAQTFAGLAGWIAAFDREDTPYLARVAPFRAGLSGDYDHLARVREWSLSGWDPA